MFHANNIEACIEHVCNISTRYFQKLPLAFRATQFVDNTFSANNLTCTMSRQLWHYYGSHQRTGLTLGPKLWLSLWSEFHVQCTSTSQCYQKMESKRIEFTLEEDPLLCTLYRRHNQSQAGLSLDSLTTSSSAPATFHLQRFFSRVVSNWAAWGSLLETFLALFFILTACFWSNFAVIAHMRKSVVLERR